MLGWKEVQYSIIKDELAFTFEEISKLLNLTQENLKVIIKSCGEIREK